MLKLMELLNITLSDYKDYKVHFAIGMKNQLDKLEMFYAGTFEADQNIQSGQNFKCRYVISLVFIGNERWLFAGVFEHKSPYIVLPNGNIKYDLSLLNIQNDLIGRIIVHYKRSYRASYTFLSKIIEAKHDLEIVELTQNKFSILDFPDYNKVNISHTQLQTIIRNALTTWNVALSHTKGVYLITDTLTGKHYVGSAKGDKAIWQRWSDYSRDGHGNDVELKDIVTKTPGYEFFFKYSILEVCTTNTDVLYISDRESFWKDTLMSRVPFGLNRN